MTNQVNWNSIIVDTYDMNVLEQFVKGEMSGNEFYKFYVGSEVSPQVRQLLRSRGVVEARQLARKALRRRGVRV
jgi:hypothetical protein